jgi:hypothetical protein
VQAIVGGIGGDVFSKPGAIFVDGAMSAAAAAEEKRKQACLPNKEPLKVMNRRTNKYFTILQVILEVILEVNPLDLLLF